jgi:hypothetical protein
MFMPIAVPIRWTFTVAGMKNFAMDLLSRIFSVHEMVTGMVTALENVEKPVIEAGNILPRMLINFLALKPLIIVSAIII